MCMVHLIPLSLPPLSHPPSLPPLPSLLPFSVVLLSSCMPGGNFNLALRTGREQSLFRCGCARSTDGGRGETDMGPLTVGEGGRENWGKKEGEEGGIFFVETVIPSRQRHSNLLVMQGFTARSTGAQAAQERAGQRRAPGAAAVAGERGRAEGATARAGAAERRRRRRRIVALFIFSSQFGERREGRSDDEQVCIRFRRVAKKTP